MSIRDHTGGPHRTDVRAAVVELRQRLPCLAATSVESIPAHNSAAAASAVARIPPPTAALTCDPRLATSPRPANRRGAT
ncbi:hypothetical protein SacxiDRAFT_1199 [Saccharomonospora xinjiangensis XJ-54]|uniref:Uncharacterized protein n=1 Tax=Saccharomonospora xinjiangensis XJ-54 TaxID=882086 RepID=I0V005_9PSEU|nr:hypothetical protein SacxiDRAFT_1199 [Saccharomonospora xinjiangensis XJ-54]